MPLLLRDRAIIPARDVPTVVANPSPIRTTTRVRFESLPVVLCDITGSIQWPKTALLIVLRHVVRKTINICNSLEEFRGGKISTREISNAALKILARFSFFMRFSLAAYKTDSTTAAVNFSRRRKPMKDLTVNGLLTRFSVRIKIPSQVV